MPISDKRMLSLMEYAIGEQMAEHESDYLAKIGFPRTNIGNVRRGHQSFTRDHIYNACKLTGANANWIFGFETNMLRKEPKDPLEMIKAAVQMMESKKK